MAQITTLEKVRNHKNIIDTDREMKMRDLKAPLLVALAETKISYDTIVLTNKLRTLAGHPIIFSVNHYSVTDTPLICSILQRLLHQRAYILAGKQNLEPLDELFFNEYGTIFVDRANKQDMLLSKVAMEAYLCKNRNIIVFPEGTWNLTDELLMMYMKWGIIDVSQNTNAQIIPIVFDFDKQKNRCYVRFGNPILPTKNADKGIEITKLRDNMATLKWNLICKKGELCRNQVDIDILRQEFLAVLDEYPAFDFECEQSFIFRPYLSPEQVFEPIKNLQLRKENAFLFGKNITGIR